MKLVRAAIVFALLSLTASAKSQESIPQTPQIEPEQQPKSRLEPKQPNDQQQEGRQQPSLGIEEIRRERGQGEGHGDPTDGDQQGTEFWPPFHGYRLKVTDTLLVAFTFLLFWATLALWLSTRRLVKGAEATAKRQLRAYVVTKIKDVVLPGSAVEHVFAIRMDIKNAGQTPAYDLRIISRTKFVDYPFPPRFDFSIPFVEDPSQGTLGPQQDVEAESRSDPLTEADWAQIFSVTSAKRLCTWGRVAYTDIFKEPQYTNFCVGHLFERSATGGVTLMSHTCKDHSDAS
jgi:hypothetical protein